MKRHKTTLSTVSPETVPTTPPGRPTTTISKGKLIHVQAYFHALDVGIRKIY